MAAGGLRPAGPLTEADTLPNADEMLGKYLLHEAVAQASGLSRLGQGRHPLECPAVPEVRGASALSGVWVTTWLFGSASATYLRECCLPFAPPAYPPAPS